MEKKQSIKKQKDDIEVVDANPSAHMGLFSGVAMIVGMIIGSGIFCTAGPAFTGTGSVAMCLIFWVLSGLFTICGGVCYVELGCAMPTSGGEHNYLLRAYGPYVAYVFDWTQTLLALPVGSAIISMVFAEYLLGLAFYQDGVAEVDQIKPGMWHIKFLAMGLIIFLSAANVFSAKLGSKISNVTMVLKLGALAFIIAIGFYYIGTGNVKNFQNSFANSSSNFLDYGNAFVSQLFAYTGWNNLNYMISELKNPQRNLPLAIAISMLIVISVYLLTNIAYFSVLDLNVIRTTGTIATQLGIKAIGLAGAIIIPIMVCFSCVGAVNSMIYGNSRLMASTGKEGVIFPKIFAKPHHKFNTPYFSLIVNCILACVYCLPPSDEVLNVLINMYCFVTLVFNFATVMGLIVLRRTEPNMHRPFKVFLPIAWVFCIICLSTIFLPLVQAFNNLDILKIVSYALVLVIMSIPVFIVYRKSRN